MPHQPYFVVVLAHSLHGRLRRIHIPHKVIYGGSVLSIVSCIAMLGFLSSYLRMSWKVYIIIHCARKWIPSVPSIRNSSGSPIKKRAVGNTGKFAGGFGRLRSKPQAWNLHRHPSSSALAPTFRESLNSYNFLQNSTILAMYHNYPKQWQTHVRPSLWPVEDA